MFFNIKDGRYNFAGGYIEISGSTSNEVTMDRLLKAANIEENLSIGIDKLNQLEVQLSEKTNKLDSIKYIASLKKMQDTLTDEILKIAKAILFFQEYVAKLSIFDMMSNEEKLKTLFELHIIRN